MCSSHQPEAGADSAPILPFEVSFTREDTDSYIVWRGADQLGEVFKVWLPSRVRRGRMQTDPWWLAKRRNGVMVVVDGRDAWQSRREAAAALVAVA